MMYTLAGLSGPDRGWGIKDDTFHSLAQLGKYGETTWFKLGDKDLATHILRTKMLREGKTLTEVTYYLVQKLGIQARILPMTNQRVETFIRTDRGTIPFQEYFVLQQKKAHIAQVIFKGLRKAHITDEVTEAIERAELIVFVPSNPIVSVLPILSIPGVRKSISASPAMKIAVSPFIGKKAVSGPAKELMECKGFEGSSTGLAHFYVNLVDHLVIHHQDEVEKERIEQTGITAAPADTIMKDIDDSIRLAQMIFQIFSARKG
jgi:LPPG:FO 2-phospho-L-lactate transferase